MVTGQRPPLQLQFLDWGHVDDVLRQCPFGGRDVFVICFPGAFHGRFWHLAGKQMHHLSNGAKEESAL